MIKAKQLKKSVNKNTSKNVIHIILMDDAMTQYTWGYYCHMSRHGKLS